MRAILRTVLLATVAVTVLGNSLPARARMMWRHASDAGLPFIVRGAQALEAGRIEEGLALTQAGLARDPGPKATAVAFANLCAGYAMLKRYDEALPRCNRAIVLDPRDWHPYNNRAAIFTARGQYELAMADVKAGLALAPDSPTLLKSLAVVRESRRVQRERLRTSIPA